MDAAEWDRRYAEGGIGRTAVSGVRVLRAVPNDVVAAEVGDLPPGRALDLASGAGRHAVWLALRGWTVTAVDFSAVAVGLTRSLAGQEGVDVDVQERDVATWVPPAATFDLVLVAYLHLAASPRAGVLRRAATALARGGVLLVVGHDVTNRVGGPPDVSILLDPQVVAAELAAAGLTVERAERVRRPVTGDGDAIDTLVRAVASGA